MYKMVCDENFTVFYGSGASKINNGPSIYCNINENFILISQDKLIAFVEYNII